MSGTLRRYAPLWNKYRPAILKMMLAAAFEPQQYKLAQHELHAMDDRKRGGFGFNLSLAKSRATNNIKDSEIAQDLLNMLLVSRKGAELLEQNTYEISLDKQCVLHVAQIKLDQSTN